MLTYQGDPKLDGKNPFAYDMLLLARTFPLIQVMFGLTLQQENLHLHLDFSKTRLVLWIQIKIRLYFS